MQGFSNKRFLQVLLLLSSALFVVTVFPFAEAHGPTVSVDNARLKPTGTMFTIDVEFAALPAFNFYEVYVAVNPGALSPVSITLGAKDASWTVLAACVNGVGADCTLIDGGGIAHSAAVSTTGASISGRGVLFTVTYTAVNNVPGTFLKVTTASSVLHGSTGITFTVVSGEYGAVVG